jgi:hypothetical protein
LELATGVAFLYTASPSPLKDAKCQWDFVGEEGKVKPPPLALLEDRQHASF